MGEDLGNLFGHHGCVSIMGVIERALVSGVVGDGREI